MKKKMNKAVLNSSNKRKEKKMNYRFVFVLLAFLVLTPACSVAHAHGPHEVDYVCDSYVYYYDDYGTEYESCNSVLIEVPRRYTTKRKVVYTHPGSSKYHGHHYKVNGIVFHSPYPAYKKKYVKSVKSKRRYKKVHKYKAKGYDPLLYTRGRRIHRTAKYHSHHPRR
jgi:hypothetical protein